MKILFLNIIFFNLLLSTDWYFDKNIAEGYIGDVRIAQGQLIVSHYVSNITRILKIDSKDNDWENIITIDTFDYIDTSMSSAHNLKVLENGNFFLWGSRIDFVFARGNINSSDFIIKVIKFDDLISHFEMFDENNGYAHTQDSIYFTNDNWRTYKTKLREGDNRQYFTDTYRLDDKVFFLGRRSNQSAIFRFDTTSLDFIKLHHFGYTHPSTIHATNNFLKFGAGEIGNGVGDQSTDLIFRSFDGGRSWEKIIEQDVKPVFGLSDISFQDELNGVAVGNNGKIYMTNDGGDNWVVEVPEEIWHEGDIAYGPAVQKVIWYENEPFIFSTTSGNVYRYNGDFFNFNYKRIKETILIEPIDNEELNINNATFNWSTVEDAESYTLHISETQDYDSVMAFETEQLELEISDLLPNKTYYWRVLSQKGTQIRESETRVFNTILALDPPVIESTCDREFDVDEVKIKWNETNFQTEIQISTNEDFDNVLTTNTFSKSSATLSNLEPGILYYFRARFLTETENSGWSDICQFITQLRPPKIIYPVCNLNDIKTDTMVTWKASQNAISYQVIIENETASVTDSISTSNTFISVNLINDSNHILTIKSLNTITESNQTKCSFVTEPLSSVDNRDELHLRINPNPVQDQLNISFKLEKPEQLELFITDILGNRVDLVQSGFISSSDQNISYPISHLPAGVYLLTIQTGDIAESIKFIKE